MSIALKNLAGAFGILHSCYRFPREVIKNTECSRSFRPRNTVKVTTALGRTLQNIKSFPNSGGEFWMLWARALDTLVEAFYSRRKLRGADSSHRKQREYPEFSKPLPKVKDRIESLTSSTCLRVQLDSVPLGGRLSPLPLDTRKTHDEISSPSQFTWN